MLNAGETMNTRASSCVFRAISCVPMTDWIEIVKHEEVEHGF